MIHKINEIKWKTITGISIILLITYFIIYRTSVHEFSLQNLCKISENRPSSTLHSFKDTENYCPVISPNLRKWVRVVEYYPVPKIEALETELNWVLNGGHWQPNCHAQQKIAIIVPYRNRKEHLHLFLLNIHKFLRRQQRHYTIFVVEQNGRYPFNRGSLMNIGFKEASMLSNFDCFIFHDVDLVPEDDRNLYGCGDMPKHFTTAISNRGYELQYPTNFGGAEGFRKQHFQLINGYSNRYWGWGSEDDDLFDRVWYHNLTISRYYGDITRYTMLGHEKAKPGPDRQSTYSDRQKYFAVNGLNSLKYELVEIKYYKLYTRIFVNLNKDDE